MSGQAPEDGELEYDDFFREPIRSLAVNREPGDSRPRSNNLKKYAERTRVANLVCSRRARTLLAVVLRGNLIPTTDGVLERLGIDFWADCRCDIAHAIDGDLLLRAVLDLPERKRRERAPVIDVRHVERRNPA